MPKTPEAVTAHGIWELHRRYADALALLPEQNEEIIVQLKNLNEPVSK